MSAMFRLPRTYFCPALPRSPARMWPRATSRTWTMFSPVSSEPTILPLRKSTIICPVGAIERARVPGPQTVIGGDVIDTSRARHRGAERVAVEQIALGDLDAAAFEGPPVAPRAREHAHGAAIGEKLADEIGADEPGPP